MKKVSWITFFWIVLITVQTPALEITSLAPIRGTPGTLVGISGGPFSSQTQTFLGEQYISPLQTSENYIEFTVPYLPPGNYSLTVQDNTMATGQSYLFEVMAPTPQITNLSPSILDVCTMTPENQLQVNGRNFLPGAVLLVNDRVVPSRVSSSTSLEAQLPGFQTPGVYGVSVRNPDGATSLPHSLGVNSIPEINSVERGADFVNYYEVIIHGKNFLYNSTLVVKEPEASTIGQTYLQLFFVPQKRSQGGMDINAPQRNRLIYVDCQTLIYLRYPSSFQNKDLGLQVFNPDGQKTNQHFVVLP